jgi:AbrB family looped-hinge helix DNA binding protein
MANSKPAKFIAKVTTNGRVTLPDRLRELWNIQTGDMVELEILNVQNIKSNKTQGKIEKKGE